MNDATILWKPEPGWRPDAELGNEELTPLRLLVMPGRQRVDIHQSDVVVGRHSLAEVRLADPDISRRHCRLVFSDGLWRVQDLNSLNGVYLNGQRVEDAVLYQGDQLRLGGCTLFVEQSAVPLRQGASDEKLQSIADAMASEAPVSEVA